MSARVIRERTLAVGWVIGSVLGSAASGQWYNGDPDLSGGTSAEFNTLVTDSYMFEDFDHPGGPITAIYANYLFNAVLTGYKYEIRSGMSNGFGGTLHRSGDTDGPYSLQYNDGAGWDGFGFLSYHLFADIPDLDLAPGVYMVALSPIGDGTGRAFVQTTSGENGVGSPNDNDLNWLHSGYFGLEYQENYSGEDFSYGVEIPAPASAALLGLGALVARRRR